MNLQDIQDDLALINTKTGEIYEVDMLHDPKTAKWQKVYAKNLADMLEITGNGQTMVIAYLIKKKDWSNKITATMRVISKDTGISLKTVSRTMKILQDSNYLLKVSNGVWRFSPHVMCNGKASIGAAVIRYYDDVDRRD